MHTILPSVMYLRRHGYIYTIRAYIWHTTWCVVCACMCVSLSVGGGDMETCTRFSHVAPPPLQMSRSIYYVSHVFEMLVIFCDFYLEGWEWANDNMIIHLVYVYMLATYTYILYTYTSYTSGFIHIIMSPLCMSHVSSVYESCLLYVWVMSPLCMSHVSSMYESRLLYVWVTSPLCMS